MPNWGDVLKEMKGLKRNDAQDLVRRKYLAKFYEKTGRNVIAYYSGWLNRPGFVRSGITDEDKNGFMATIHKMDRSKGLDILLHTPGGNTASTDSIINYLKKMFGNNIRAIIPQLAMSAGTLIACACNSIIMGKQSNIGPIDPQFNGIPCQGVIAEFKKAIKETTANTNSIPMWRAIIGNYHPTFIGECQNAIDFSIDIAKEGLSSNMFKEDAKKKTKVNKIVEYLMDHDERKLHSRHIHIDKAKEIGLNILSIEDDFDDEFQDLLLTVHHCFIHTFSATPAVKIIENQLGSAVISVAPRQNPVLTAPLPKSILPIGSS